MSTSTLAAAELPRAFVRVSGPDAESYLQRMVSNDVAALEPGDTCRALLLTPKGRVIAPMRVLRRGPEDFLLVTEPELGPRLREELVAMRFSAKAEIEPEQHVSYLTFGDSLPPEATVLRNDDYGPVAWEVLDVEPSHEVRELGWAELERMRIEAGTPAWGKELDDSILPAEAGLDVTHISFTKGCYPGQEPVARLNYRGHANRRLRVIEVDDASTGAAISWNGKVIGRVTSAVPGRALGYVRTGVPADAVLDIDGVEARLH